MALPKLPNNGRIADSVYEALRNAIFDGELQPGYKLSVPALAEELGVSRSPVREAVIQLTRDRLALEEPRRGAVVARVSIDDLISLYEVREVLEGLAARLAVLHGGPRLVAELEELYAEHEQVVDAGDMEAHVDLDQRFHLATRLASENPTLIRQLDEIQTQVRLAMVTTATTGGPRRALEDHWKILEAIRAKDADEADRRARAHIARLREALSATAANPSQDDGLLVRP